MTDDQELLRRLEDIRDVQRDQADKLSRFMYDVMQRIERLEQQVHGLLAERLN
jgi:hypothetical protein